MPYRFATEDLNYSDFSAGRVLYSLPGLPAFPVRLASEIFQRAAARLPAGGAGLRIYDPTCGGAYHLTALGFLHGTAIHAITGSDMDERALGLAQRNLDLLSPEGLSRREAELRQMLAQYGKPSHTEALRSLAVLRDLLLKQPAIPARLFAANALDPSALAQGLQGAPVDLVISDIPYGQMSGWSGTDPGSSISPVGQLLEALSGQLSAQALVVIAADKAQKITHPKYRRVEHFQVGKRQVVMLSLIK